MVKENCARSSIYSSSELKQLKLSNIFSPNYSYICLELTETNGIKSAKGTGTILFCVGVLDAFIYQFHSFLNIMV